MQGKMRIYSLAYSEATSSKPVFMLTNVPSLGPGRYALVPRRRNKTNGRHGIVSATAAVRAAGYFTDTGNDEDGELEDAAEDEDGEDVEEVEAGQDDADDEDGRGSGMRTARTRQWIAATTNMESPSRPAVAAGSVKPPSRASRQPPTPCTSR
jgi:hypothetical protein